MVTPGKECHHNKKGSIVIREHSRADNYTDTYVEGRLNLAGLDTMHGRVLLEFGTNWCGHCMAAQPALKAAMANHAELVHIKEEDGKGRRPGRLFRVKLWPTLILLENGKEVARLIRPTTEAAIRKMLEADY
jgi:thioredoxin 1